MRRLAAHNFRIDNHCGSLHISVFNLIDTDTWEPKAGWKFVGYTKSSAVQFRAKPDGYAIMFERIRLPDNHELAPWGYNENVGQWVWMHIAEIEGLPEQKGT